MDDIDFGIIKRLCKDARMPFKTIAEELGMGIDAIVRRYKKLVQKGVILGSTVVLSSRVCGIQGLCGLFIKIKSGANAWQIADQLRKIPDLAEVFKMLGEYDFYVNMFYRDFEEVTSLIDKLRNIEGITTIDPMVYTEKDWSIPFLFDFETEPQAWTYT